MLLLLWQSPSDSPACDLEKGGGKTDQNRGEVGGRKQGKKKKKQTKNSSSEEFLVAICGVDPLHESDSGAGTLSRLFNQTN